ncbi:ABC transporter ATP-binding protein [Oscillospiraceae bacterium PP1C4]
MLDTCGDDILIRDTVVYFEVPTGFVRAVDHISVTFQSGKTTGLIGESGCGKSVLALSILGLLPSYARVSGEILYRGLNIAKASAKELRTLRGRKLGLIPQNPADSLNPVRRIGSQLDEALMLTGNSKKVRKAKAKDLLESFGFHDPARILRSYPFELSGGMQQRVLCAMGISCSPRWVLADEPTKGLDSGLREQVYETLSDVKRRNVDGMLIITHDLELTRKLCDIVAVMYAGEILEMGEDVLAKPLHPYTEAFLASLPENGMQPMAGLPPTPGDLFKGCKFAPRCSRCFDRCKTERPDAYQCNGRMVRCFLYA